MAITVGTLGGIQSNTITVSTLASTTKLVAIVGIHQGTVSSVTLNGTPLTFRKNAATAFNETVEIWDIDNPGALTAVSLTSSTSGGSGPTIGYINLIGSSTGAPDNSATANGSGGTASVTFTPTVDNCIIIGGMYAEANGTIGAGETQIFIVAGASFENSDGSYVIQTTASSQVVDYGLSSGQRWACCAISIAAAPTAKVGSMLLMFK